MGASACVERMFNQPGKPMQNGLIERINPTSRQEVLDCYVFETLNDAHRMTAAWISRYNEERPHESLGRVPPLIFRPRATPSPESSFKLSP